MGNVEGQAIPLAANDTDFENWVHHLLTKKYGHQANARGSRGHRQHGLDFTVYDGDIRVGVQCKHVEQGGKLNLSKVKADLAAYHSVDPPIGRFVLYSDAKNDPKTVDALDRLKEEVRRAGGDFQWLLKREFDEEARSYDLIRRFNGDEVLGPTALPTGTPAQATSPPVQDAASSSLMKGSTLAPVGAFAWLLDEVTEHLQAGDAAAATAQVDRILRRAAEVPGTELAKAYTAKAILMSRAGQIREAAEMWRKAASAEPDPGLKHGRRAHAFLSEDRYEEALDAALPGLDRDPPSILSWLAALSAAQNLGRRTELEARLTDRVRDDRNIALVRAYTALEDDDATLAADIVEAASAASPDDGDILSLQANLLFRKALGGGGRTRLQIHSGAEMAAVEAALPLYQRALSLLDPRYDRSSWAPTALNYLSALKLLDRHTDAADLALRMAEPLGDDPDNIGRVVLALAEGGQATRALEIAGRLPAGNATVAMARASALMHLARFSEAQQALDEAPAATDEQSADNISWLRVAISLRTSAGADLAALGSAFFEGAHDKLAACARMVENASGLDRPDLARQYAARAIEIFQQAPDPEFLLFVADSMVLLGRVEEAMRLLALHVDLDRPQGGLVEERLAYCLLREHRLESLGKLLSGLPAAAPHAQRFDPVRIDYQLARGDRPAALQAVRDAKARLPGDMKLLSLEVALLRDAGDRAQAIEKFLAIPFRVDVPRHAVSLFVGEARELGLHDRADEAAYQWIREHGSVPDHAAWFLTCALVDWQRREASTPLTRVTGRCGVLLRTDKDQEGRWIVIDDRYPERVAEGWFAPHSRNVATLLDKDVGSVVAFGGFPGGPFTIAGVAPVYEGAVGLLRGRYGRDIPMGDQMQLLSLRRDGENYDFSPLFEMLDAAKEAKRKALKLYAELPMPIARIASALRQDPIDFWAGLVGTEHSVRAMSGSTDAADAFARRLEGDAPAIVLDPVTLLGWHAFGILDAARAATESISMTASAVALIRSKRDAIDVKDSGPSMVLSASDEPGMYLRRDITPELTSDSCAFFDSALQWIQAHVQVLPVPASGMPEDIFAVVRRGSHPYVADSMQLAAHAGRVLVADDLGIERLAASAGVPQVPTASLLRAAAAAKRITALQLAQALREMASANYDFISFTADDLWAVTDPKAHSMTPDVAVMLRYLNNDSLQVGSGVSVVRNYLYALASNNMPPAFIASCMTTALSALTQHASRQTPEVFLALLEVSRALPARHGLAASEALKTWLNGHFLRLEHVGLQYEARRARAAAGGARLR